MMRTFTLLLISAITFCTTDVLAQYCMLPGRTSYSVNQPGITNFKLKNINRTSSNVENPLSQPSIVVTTDSAVLERGKTYVVTITHTRDSVIPTFATARNNIRVWLDYNSDKDFEDAGETVITKDFIAAGTYTDSFTVPANAKLGVTRLRVTAKMSSDAGHSVPTPCDNPADPIDYHGEMEDYTITILAASDVKNVADEKNRVSIYPNPTSGKVTLSLSNTSATELSANLYDMAGRHIAELQQPVQQNKTEYIFDLNNYNVAQGIYMIQVKNGSSVSYQRIAKVN